MDLIEWEDYSSDEFSPDVFNFNRNNALKRNLKRNFNRGGRFKRHVYEVIPEFDCDGLPIFDFPDSPEFDHSASPRFDFPESPEFELPESPVFESSDDEDYPLCRKPLNENVVGSYPASLNRSFRVVERQLIYCYW